MRKDKMTKKKIKQMVKNFEKNVTLNFLFFLYKSIDI